MNIVPTPRMSIRTLFQYPEAHISLTNSQLIYSGRPAMSASEKMCTIRECADAVRVTIERNQNNLEKLRSELLEAVRAFISREDLYELGAKRPGNHIDNSKYIYYDGELSITLDQLPKNMVVPPHDHGIWEALIILKGRLHHSVYDRLDNGSKDGHAKLKQIEDKTFMPMELAMVIPPAEIHSFTALEDETYILTIVGGNYAANRHYYNVEENTYVVAKAGSVKPKKAA
jgi:predicted metal-dependent enzyme (double-stranded beta helix superfamily)